MYTLGQSYAICKTIARSSELYPAFRLLSLRDPAKRDGLFALYGAFRFIDNLADDPLRTTGERRADLAAARRQLTWGIEHGRSSHPVFKATVHTMNGFCVEASVFDRLFDAMADDLGRRRYATFEELMGYIDGSLLAAIDAVIPLLFGQPGIDESVRAGLHGVFTGEQLADFILDVADDMADGRLYFPAEDIAAVSLDPCAPDPADRSAWQRLLSAETERAEQEFGRLDAVVDRMTPAAALAMLTWRDLWREPLRRAARSGHRRALDALDTGRTSAASTPGHPWAIFLSAAARNALKAPRAGRADGGGKCPDPTAKALAAACRHAWHFEAAANRNPGHLAGRFLGPNFKVAFPAWPLTGKAPVQDRQAPRTNRFVTARTWLIDRAWAAEAASGTDQMIVLGCGYDTSTFRLDCDGSPIVYKIDRPHALRRERNRSRGIGESHCVTRLVALDLTEPPFSALRRAGFDTRRPSLWVAGGFVHYLEESAARDILADIAGQCVPGTSIVFDYLVAPDASPWDRYDNTAHLPKAPGHPYRLTLPGDGLESFAKELGFDVEFDLPPGNLAAAYFPGHSQADPNDGLYQAYRMAHLRVRDRGKDLTVDRIARASAAEAGPPAEPASEPHPALHRR
jgi:15-cis-phytoene synthase